MENNSYLLEGKVVGFIATAEESGGEEAMMSMVEACNEMGMIAPPYSTIFHSTKIKSSWAIRDVSLLGKNLVILAKLLKKVKKSPDWKGKLYWGYPEEYD